MALRRNLTKRLSNLATSTSPIFNRGAGSPTTAGKSNFHRDFSPAPAENAGFFRRFFQRREINQASLPAFLTLPVGEKLRERLRADDLLFPATVSEKSIAGGGMTVEAARRILRVAQMERVKARLREVPSNSVSYSEFLGICVDSCENEAQGFEFAKLLDDSSNVIVLGDVVFLFPEQVAKSMETLISQTIAMPNDPRKQELEEMERRKTEIDKKAKTQVKRELYCGLGLILGQTLGFMRLTFWELNWDVMEPICFFVTSLHFALAYGFFLKTSTEPSFEGYFRRRFVSKQSKLMKAQNFDLQKYNQLRKAFYPNECSRLSSIYEFSPA